MHLLGNLKRRPTANLPGSGTLKTIDCGFLNRMFIAVAVHILGAMLLSFEGVVLFFLPNP